MPLLVEDGTIVEGANTYLDVASVIAFCSDRGITFPADSIITQKIYLAMDWFEGLRFNGSLVDTDQPLSFPREGLTQNGETISAEKSILLAKEILVQATVYAFEIDLSPVEAAKPKGEIRQEKVEGLERTYFSKYGNSANLPFMPRLQMLLEEISTYGASTGTVDGRLNILRV
jgi:hypothetical protein